MSDSNVIPHSDMFGVLADTLQIHVLPNSQVKGAPTQHCQVAAGSDRNPASSQPCLDRTINLEQP
jgi:hypothetical protein